MSIETEITRISTNVSDTLSAVSEMGGEVPEGATSNNMAAGVRSIPVGAKIDDTTPSTTTTYSSQKIEDELSALNQANAAQNTEIAKKANDADLAAVAKSGSYSDLSNKPTIPTVPSALPNPKKLKLTGAVTAEYDGSAEVNVEIPAGGGSAYELPVAGPAQLGGVKPAAKTDEMTQAVGVDEAGRLWGLPGGGSKDSWRYKVTIEVAEGETIKKLLWENIPLDVSEIVIAGTINTAINGWTMYNLSGNDYRSEIGSFYIMSNNVTIAYLLKILIDDNNNWLIEGIQSPGFSDKEFSKTALYNDGPHGSTDSYPFVGKFLISSQYFASDINYGTKLTMFAR